MSKQLNPSILTEGQTVPEVDPKYLRPTEMEMLLGNASKAENELDWMREYTTKQLIKDMIKHDSEKIEA